MLLSRSSDNTKAMTFDPLVTNPGRLRILTALAAEPEQEFVRLRAATRLTDGNLSTHARRLQSGGLVAVEKAFRQGKPVTTFILTRQGRRALEEHVEQLVGAVRPDVQPTLKLVSAPPNTPTNSLDDDWIG